MEGEVACVFGALGWDTWLWTLDFRPEAMTSPRRMKAKRKEEIARSTTKMPHRQLRTLSPAINPSLLINSPPPVCQHRQVGISLASTSNN